MLKCSQYIRRSLGFVRRCSTQGRIVMKKKGISILLIAAALFGFYGGATNLNDVLACKDYWEEEGEKSTANLNKLEDGINQLKDNEQAYLDGVDAVADGEKTLAQGKEDLAQGEADYAAGEQALAEGAAKLAQGYKDYAQGQQDLADGEEALDSLDALIAGLNAIKSNYNKSYKPGIKTLIAGNHTIKNTLKENKSLVETIESLTGKDGLYSNAVGAKTYKKFDKAVVDLKDAFETTKETLTNYKKMAESAATNKELSAAATSLNNDLIKDYDVPTMEENVSKLEAGIADAESKKAALEESKAALEEKKVGLETKKSELESQKDSLDKLLEAGSIDQDTYDKKVKAINNGISQCESRISQCESGISQYAAGISQYEAGIKQAQAQKAGLESAIEGRSDLKTKVSAIADESLIAKIKAISPELGAGIEDCVNTICDENSTNSEVATAVTKLQGYFQTLADTIGGVITKLEASIKGFTEWDKGWQKLNKGQHKLANGIKTVFNGALGSPTIKSELTSSQIKALKKYKGSLLSNTGVAKFSVYMEQGTGSNASCLSTINSLLKVANGLKKSGTEAVVAGKQQLTDAAKQLAQGEKDLAAGQQELAEGAAKLEEGRQQLADGEKDLADGKKQLAQYEDGEQQVRDGLATLMGTEANGGLTSIAERVGDDNFDNADGHLNLDKGLSAVGSGREYSDDSGVVITDELTKRAVQSVAAILAAILAVLAAILSLAKKNKGASVCAVLTAVAGVVAVVAGQMAGLEMSSIAGSLIGATPKVAAGILAAVAAVFAGIHISDKGDQTEAEA